MTPDQTEYAQSYGTGFVLGIVLFTLFVAGGTVWAYLKARAVWRRERAKRALNAEPIDKPRPTWWFLPAKSLTAEQIAERDLAGGKFIQEARVTQNELDNAREIDDVKVLRRSIQIQQVLLSQAQEAFEKSPSAPNLKLRQQREVDVQKALWALENYYHDNGQELPF